MLFFILTDSSFVTEPFYGTICLYNKERRDKLSEDFHFQISPSEAQDVSHSFQFKTCTPE